MAHTETALRGVCLYCLARSSNAEVIRQLSLASGESEAHFPVEVLDVDGLQAVIGEIDTGQFTEENLQAIGWLGPRAMWHDTVVDGVSRSSTILPVKFGTIFKSPESLAKYLAQHQSEILARLDYLADKREWSLKGYLGEAQARQMISATDAQIQARVAALSGSPGVRYLQERQIETLIDASLRAWIERLGADLCAQFGLHAVDSAMLRCHASAMTGRAERMVFNCCFLISPGAHDDFADTLTAQRLVYEGTGLTLELRGPWPPYNFCPPLQAPEE